MAHGGEMVIPKFQELSDVEIDAASVEALRAAYRALLKHHIEETEKLWQKLKAARAQEQP